MKRIKIDIILILCLLFGASTGAVAQTASNSSTIEPIKREFRSAWITTAWAQDWPGSSFIGSGTTIISRQKSTFRYLIDNLHKANFNAVFFQARSFCDAMYKSSYEPWSRYLTGTRGKDPGYDPMAYGIEYAHSKGMEFHVWINPYRYASSDANYGTLPTDLAVTHPEWIVDGGAQSDGTHPYIINPSIPEVREYIATVIADLVRNYDVDGVLFDDYFYLSGMSADLDKAYYEANNPNGLSLADWRRDNVNKMVAQVRDSIKSIKPYCRFGIGPAGIATTNLDVATKYGVVPCPVGSDWQYNGIYSDPLAWLSAGTVDYLSPQLYWQIGSNTGFERVSEWWSMVANKFGRHVYPSSSLSGLGTDFKTQEIVDQIKLNRVYDRNGAPGSVMYYISHAINNVSGFVNDIANKACTTPALPPTMVGADLTQQNLMVSNLTLTDNTLTWTAPAANLRYAIYLLPQAKIGQAGVLASGEYLQALSYTPSYTLAEDVPAGYVCAVSVVDRFGTEYSAVVLGETQQTAQAAQLTYPAHNAEFVLPVYFKWQSVAKADSYIFQLSEKADFSTIFYQQEVLDTQFDITKVGAIQDEKTYYWRVITRTINALDAYSEVRAFTATVFGVNYPLHQQTELELTPEIICDSIQAEGVEYKYEIATEHTFRSTTIIYTATTDQPRHQMPENALSISSTYYLRVSATYDGITFTSLVTQFATLNLPVAQPVIIKPAEGEVVVGTELVVTWQEQHATGYRVEYAATADFTGRTVKRKEIKDGNTYTVTFTSVKPGNYYLRVQAYSPADGEYKTSATRAFSVVKTATDLESTTQAKPYIVDNILYAPVHAEYTIYTLSGQLLYKGKVAAAQTLLPALPVGQYMVQLNGQTIRYGVK